MNKQDFLNHYMEYLRTGKFWRFKISKEFNIDHIVVEEMDEGQFKEFVFFNLRKLRQEFEGEIDRLTRKVVKGGFR